jgi:hypothetical protein
MKPKLAALVLVVCGIAALAVFTPASASVTITRSTTEVIDGVMAEIPGPVADGRIVVTQGTTGEQLRATAITIDGAGIFNAPVVTAGAVTVTGGINLGGGLNGQKWLVETPAANVALDAANSGLVALCDTTPGPFTVVLPSPAPSGTHFTITQIGGAPNSLTVAPSGNDTVDGAGAFTFPARGNGQATWSWTLVYDAGNWAVTSARE